MLGPYGSLAVTHATLPYRARQRTQGLITAKTCQNLPMTAMPALSHTGHARAGLHEPCVLLKLGEIVLKGKNRQQFERLLQNNIRLAAADLGVSIKLWQRDGVIVLNPVPAGPAGPAPAAAEATARAMSPRTARPRRWRPT